MRVKVLVCCHEKSSVFNDDIYMPIQCGKALSDFDLGIHGDDEGDNISYKNKTYCELTAIYWAWKNLKCPNVDYVGLCHYRRFFDFSFVPYFNKESENITLEDLQSEASRLSPLDCLKQNNIVLPSSLSFQRSIFEVHAFNLNYMDVCVLEKVILDLYPEYRTSVEYVFYHNRNVPQRNMFVMRKDIFDRYCEFLFSVLFEVEKYVRLSPYSYYQRVFGFMGEMLLPLFIYHNRYSFVQKRILFIDKSSNNSNILSDLAIDAFNKLRFFLNTRTSRPIYSIYYQSRLKQEFPDLFK